VTLQFFYNIMSVAFLLGLGCDLVRMWSENRRLKAELARLRTLERTSEQVGRFLGRSLEQEQKRHRALRERLGKAGVL
jgi:hypothetical protein